MVAAAMYDNIAAAPLLLGGAPISAAMDGTTLFTPIGPAGLTYLNSFAGGPAIIGGTVPSAIPPDTPQQPFGFTGPDIPGGDPLTPMLVVDVVPEPTTLATLAFGTLLVGGFRRKSRP
jgi:hypothetical protein